MDESHPAQRCYRFGCFVLDLGRLQLNRDDDVVVLSPKAFEVLALLVERRGELVTKDELLSTVWPDTTVEENNLARQVSTLRRLLGDTREHHEYIATIPGRGYRFVAPAEVIGSDNGAASARSESGTTVALDRGHRRESPEGDDHAARLNGVVTEPTPRGRRLRRWALVAAAALLPVAGMMLVGRGGRLDEGNSAVANLRRLTYGASLQHQPAWSPDGRRVVFASEVSGNSDLWVQDLDLPLPVQLTTGAGHEWQPAWSPDDQWIAYRGEGAESGVFVVPSAGGEPRRLTTFGHYPRWSPSGGRILFSGSSLAHGKASLWTVSVDGTGPERVRPDVLRDFPEAYVAWRPGTDDISVWGRLRSGEQVFLTTTIEPGGDSVFSEVPDAVGASMETLGLSFGAFSWAPSGDYLYFEGRTQDATNIWRVRVDAASLAWRDRPVRLTVGSVNRDFSISPDGRRLAFSSIAERTRLWAFGFEDDGRVDGGVPVTSGSAGEFDAAAPRDGRQLAYRTERGGRQQLWARAMPDGVDRVLLAGNDWRGTSPRWGPDGRTLAYSRHGLGIGLVNADTGEDQLLVLPSHLDMNIVPDDWSPDGSTILAACRRKRGEGYSMCLVTLNDRRAIDDVRVIAVAPPGHALICARFSPNQRWISFMVLDRQQPSVSTLYVMPAEGGAWVPVTSGTSYDDKPRWSADGHTLYYLSDRAGLMNLWGQSFDAGRGVAAGPPVQVTHFNSPSRAIAGPLDRVEIAVSHDQVFLPLTDAAGDIWILDLP